MNVNGSAMVTGASRGIGRAIAVELVQRGISTVAGVRDPERCQDLAALGGIEVTHLDVTDPTTLSVRDDLQILVNNAGIDSEYLPVEFSDLDDWRSLFETNVIGVVAMCQAAIPTLRANRPAVICNVTSSSILASQPFYSAYRATKAAVSVMGDSLRVEVAPQGIRVVEILPGPIDTDMFRLSAGEPAAARFIDYEGMAERGSALRRQVADPLVSPPQDAAKLIVDAIFDDHGPMRYGCDPLSVGLLDLWRQSDDERLFQITGQALIGPEGS